MEFPQQTGSGTPVPKTTQRRSHGRSLNERTAPEYYSAEDLTEAEMSSHPDEPTYVTFTRATAQPTVASHKRQAQNSRRLLPQDYHENYYTPPNSPVAGCSNTYPVYGEQNSADSRATRDQLDETVYEDKVDEGQVEEVDLIHAYDYGPVPPQHERLLRKECYSAREVPCCEHNVTQQRRYRKLPHSNYDMPQASSSRRSRSPTRQEISETIQNIWQQNKPRRMATRSYCDAEGRLYTQSRSPEYDLSDTRRYQEAYAHLLKPGALEKLKHKMPEGYLERVRQRLNKEMALLAQGKGGPTRPLPQYPPPSDFAAGEEYFKNLQTMFRDLPNDAQELTAAREVELEKRKARNSFPAETFYPKY